MYSKLPNLVIGFHGCDQSTCDRVLYSGEALKKSDNSYDWLGNGIYLWENSYQRALDWARHSKKIKEPAVLGVIVDLGHCLNLADYGSSEILRRGYEILKIKNQIANAPMPQNRNIPNNTDLLLRDLDCAVIQQIHEYHKEAKLPMYDSVRGVFIEGGEAYPGSGFREKTHVQLCIVNMNCIKGYFRPLTRDDRYPMP